MLEDAGVALPDHSSGSLGTETWNEALCLFGQGSAGQPGLCHGGRFPLSASPAALTVLAALASCAHTINQT